MIMITAAAAWSWWESSEDEWWRFIDEREKWRRIIAQLQGHHQHTHTFVYLAFLYFYINILFVSKSVSFRSILRFEFDLWRRIRRIQWGRVAKCRSSTTEGTKDTENSKNKPLVQTKNDWRWKGKKKRLKVQQMKNLWMGHVIHNSYEWSWRFLESFSIN